MKLEARGGVSFVELVKQPRREERGGSLGREEET